MSSGHRVSFLVAMILPLFAWAARGEGELEVTARLQPELIGVDELAHLSIEVQGSGFGGRNFDPTFELDNLEVVNGPSTSQSFRFVNGAASRGLTLSWVLRPKTVGPARVHSIQVQVGNDVYQLPEATIEVQQDLVGRLQPSQGRRVDSFEDFFPRIDGRPRRPVSRPKVFLRAEVQPRNPFVGQQALYTLYLFTQADVTSISPEKLPNFNGLWVRELPQPKESTTEMVDIDGERYRRVALLRRAVFPLRAGPIELESAKVQLGIRVPDRTFGSMFAQSRQIRRDSNAVSLDARELPAQAPEGFRGAVGKLRVAAELMPTQVTMGDAATFSITLSGSGNLQGLPAPTLSEVAGLRTFPPQQESDERFVGNQVQGRRTWSYVLVPEAPGRYRLPAIELSYFDPARGEFLTARAPATQLEVAAAPAEELDRSEAATAARETPQQAAGNAHAGTDWAQMLPWVLVALLVGTLGVVAWGRMGQEGSHSPAPALAAALRLAAKKEKPREAAALIENGWRDFLKSRWHIPPSTPSTQWGRRLREAGAGVETAQRLVELADDLHYLRYAPQLSDTAALHKELILRSTKLRRTLR
ncbi:MAG: BatD family protein [Acidobacteria bacterium]|nr:BatD family protein [Acidobacteriota bacterium]